MNNGLVLLGGWIELFVLLVLLVWVPSRARRNRQRRS